MIGLLTFLFASTALTLSAIWFSYSKGKENERMIEGRLERMSSNVETKLRKAGL